jgi:hypothetical protein
MFGGFLLVATAVRDDSGGGFGQPQIEEEIGMQAAGFTMVGLGLIVGPSVGHLYAGDTLWGLAGMGLRLLTIGGSAGLMTAGGMIASEGRDNRGSGAAVMALGTAAACVGLGLVIWDLLDAPEAARRANAEHRKKDQAVPIPDVQVGAGSLSLRWRF